MITDKTIKQLRTLGLNSYEAKIWAALLNKKESTAGELSDIATVPRSRSYDVLESLEKKGFVKSKKGKPMKYVALSPKQVLDNVKKNSSKNADSEIKELDTINKKTLLELETLHEQGLDSSEPNEISGTLRGRTNLYNHIEHTLKKRTKKRSDFNNRERICKIIFKIQNNIYKTKKRSCKSYCSNTNEQPR